MFEIETNVKFHDADAAGILFFANHFRIAHTAFESFMKSIGCSLESIIQESVYLLPIVHAEADYKASLSLGSTFAVSMTAEVGRTSFVISYSFKDAQGTVAAKLKTVHVSIDKKTKEKIELPEELRAGLLTIT